jgi:hypothetical protein
VERELTEDLRRVRGNETILFRLAETAVEHPDDTVRDAFFSVVGEKTLQELVREAKANERVFQERVRTVLRGSYSNYYRRLRRRPSPWPPHRWSYTAPRVHRGIDQRACSRSCGTRIRATRQRSMCGSAYG